MKALPLLLLTLSLLPAPAQARSKLANELAAIGSLRAISSSQSLFREADKDQNGVLDYAGNLAALGKAKLVDPILGAGEKSGYRFKVTRGAKAPEFTWMATAEPVKPGGSGDRYFAVNHKGATYHSLKPIPHTPECTITGVLADKALPGWEAVYEGLAGILKRAADQGLLKGTWARSAFAGQGAGPTKLVVAIGSDSGLEIGRLRDTLTLNEFRFGPLGNLTSLKVSEGSVGAKPKRLLRGRWERGQFLLKPLEGPPISLEISEEVIPVEYALYVLPALSEAWGSAEVSFPVLVVQGTKTASPKGLLKLSRTAKVAPRPGATETERSVQLSHPVLGTAWVWVSTAKDTRGQVLAVQGFDKQVLTRTTAKKARELVLASLTPKDRTRLAQASRVALAKAHLNAFKAGLSMYKSDMGRYPRHAKRPSDASAAEADAAMADDSPCLYAAMRNKPTLQAGGGQNSPYLMDWKPEAIGLVERAYLRVGAFASADKGVRPLSADEQAQLDALEFQQKHAPKGKGKGSLLVFLDPWGSPYHYREWSSVRMSTKDALMDARRKREVVVEGKKRIVLDGPMNPESFDVWSNGPNGVNEYGARDSDDVVSWRR
jgi:hypothetical protein